MMPSPNPAAMEFLLTRRSRPAKTLAAPAPTRAELAPILTAAARSPDHGMLVPWRFVVLERAALARLGGMVPEIGARLGKSAEDITKACATYDTSPLVVAVISTPKAVKKFPESEQIASAAAVCLSLLNAALASGWGASWITGWPVYDKTFVTKGLGLAPGETVAGMIHIGTETAEPPERPRPDLEAITTWVDA